MREKAKELQRQKLEAVKKGGKSPMFSATTGFGSNAAYNPIPNIESLLLRGNICCNITITYEMIWINKMFL